jgi:peptide/nickel transport system permease protein
MALTNNNAVNQERFMENAPRVSEFRRIVRVFFGRKLAVLGFSFIVLLVVVAIFAPLLARHDPFTQDIKHTLATPSISEPLGTDELGRDLLSRIIYGSRISLIIGIGAVGSAAIVGQSLGLIAAYFGGKVFTIIMRAIDSLMSIPPLLLFIIIAGSLGGGMRNVILALAIGMIPVHCRLMCGQALSIKQNDYVMAGRSIGASDVRIMLKHIFPNAFPPLLVVITMDLGTAILAEASLSFLGVGIEPPTPAWGSMVNEGRSYLLSNSIISIAPGLAIMLVVFGFNMMGDGLRDALDPRLRGTF